jgi:hypothetical protein
MHSWLAVMLLAVSAGATSAQEPGTQGANEAQSTAAAGSGPADTTVEGARKTGAHDSTATEKKKPKKVWTNDEIGSVKGGVSVVGDGRQGEPSRSRAEEPSGDSHDARPETVRKYRDQIRQLRDQMAAADRRIEQLKSFKGENASPSGGININQGYNMVPVEEQVKQLEEKKRQLEGKIEDVEVEAKRNGVDPGELR